MMRDIFAGKVRLEIRSAIQRSRPPARLSAATSSGGHCHCQSQRFT